jgi:hypothetical protein
VPNWEPIVRQTFRDLRLRPKQCDEVIAELCAHLEDRFEELRSQRVSEGEAFEICLKEVTALHDRKRLIQCAKNEENYMNRRTKTLWLPGFVSLTTASLLLMFVEYLTFFRSRVSVSHQVTYAYLAWLLLLPFCGAAGAILSRKSNGTLSARLTSGLFPSLTMCGAFALILPLEILINRNSYVMSHPLAFLQAVSMWVLAPAVALLVGAAPFCTAVNEPIIKT